MMYGHEKSDPAIVASRASTRGLNGSLRKSDFRYFRPVPRCRAADVGAIISAAETGTPRHRGDTGGRHARPSQVRTKPVYFRIYFRRVYVPYCDFIASMARPGERKPANKLAQDQPVEAGRHGAPAWICTRPTAN
jgi:hypothetical protein